jgi:ribosome-associated protein
MDDFAINIQDLSAEFQFFTSRSSGPGGQNVNKVNSKVELRFDVQNSSLLTQEQKDLICIKLASKINDEGILSVVSQRDRSQLSNKEDAIQKLYQLLVKALTPVKPRKKTRPTQGSIEKRLTQKRLKAETKQNRQKFSE